MDINIRVRVDSPDIMNSFLALADAILQSIPKTSKQENVVQAYVGPEKEQKNTVTLEQVRERLASLTQAGKSAQVKSLINKYGANKLTEINAECYEALYKEAGTYLN